MQQGCAWQTPPLPRVQMEVEVRDNVFEHQRIALSGDAYLEEVTLSGLLPGPPAELRLPDVGLGQPAEFSFSVRNASAKHFRSAPPGACMAERKSALPLHRFVACEARSAWL